MTGRRRRPAVADRPADGHPIEAGPPPDLHGTVPRGEQRAASPRRERRDTGSRRDLRDAGPRRELHVAADEELLSLLLGSVPGTRSATAFAGELVRASGGMGALSRASPRELALVSGVGSMRATRVAAAFELGRRALSTARPRDVIGNAEDVHRLCAPRVAGLAQEVFFVIGLDVRNGLLEVTEVARGTVHGVEVHPREVFRPLIRMAAAGAVVAHNHPSGDPTPSMEDLELTRRLRHAGDIVGIPVIDHVVLGDGGFRSISEWLGVDP